MAKLWKETYGLQFDVKRYFAYLEEGLNPVRDGGVHVGLEKSRFLYLIEKINVMSKNILSKLNSSIDNMQLIDDEYLIKHPERLPSILANLFNKLIGITANNDPYTFFALNISRIPEFLLKNMYPIVELDILLSTHVLEPVYIPRVNDVEKRTKYTIFGLNPNSVIYDVYRLNCFIWDLFDYLSLESRLGSLSEPDLYYPFFFVYGSNIPNLKKNFIEQRVEPLFDRKKRIDISESIFIDSYEQFNCSKCAYGYERYVYGDPPTFIVDKDIVVKVVHGLKYRSGSSWQYKVSYHKNSRPMEHAENIHVFKLIRNLAKPLAFGLVDPYFFDEKIVIYEGPLIGWEEDWIEYKRLTGLL